MKKSSFFFCPILFGSIAMAVLHKKSERFNAYTTPAFSPSAAIGCAPGAEGLTAGPNGKFITVMPGRGTHAYTISTKSDSAQIYFNQGLSMYYSYHSREAAASFKEAARFDTTCAMAYWGQALAMGPSYNFGYTYKMNAAIPSVLKMMNRYAQQASAREQDLIAAMNSRYDVTDTADRQRSGLNAKYAEAMKPLVLKYATDLDVKALYTDAVMLIHPWDFWFNDGTPKAWTPELVRYCEEILKQDPHHPAALHYYIHVTEASRKPDVALASADSLIKLYPGIAHMVHMSSHEYERIGYYSKGVIANEKADRSLVIYDSLAKGLFPQVHVPHYYAVDAYCALSGAMYRKGLQKSITLRNSVKPTPDVMYPQYQYLFPQLAMVRLGKWQEIIKDRTPVDSAWTYAGILNDFARGMAYANTGDLQQAQILLSQLREKKTDKRLKENFSPYTSSPYECAEVAENILQGTIHFRQRDFPSAISAINKAILAEDKLIYSEPKLWMLPARQYLGAYLLQLKQPREAEKQYREDLVWNPGNGWSMVGLYKALEAQGKTTELAGLKKRYTVSFSEAELIPDRSAY